MNSIKHLANSYRTSNAFLRVRSAEVSALSHRYKSDSSDKKKPKPADLRGYFYPNTDVGIKERSIKGEPVDPIQRPYPPFPDGKNPKTGEVGGPAGPEPTRFGDWERKGRVTDF